MHKQFLTFRLKANMLATSLASPTKLASSLSSDSPNSRSLLCLALFHAFLRSIAALLRLQQRLCQENQDTIITVSTFLYIEIIIGYATFELLTALIEFIHIFEFQPGSFPHRQNIDLSQSMNSIARKKYSFSIYILKNQMHKITAILNVSKLNSELCNEKKPQSLY